MNVDSHEAHCERVRQIHDSFGGNAGSMAVEIDRLRLSATAAAKDAARYRWLRGGDYSWEQERRLRDGRGWLLTDDELDAAVDKEMGYVA